MITSLPVLLLTCTTRQALEAPLVGDSVVLNGDGGSMKADGYEKQVQSQDIRLYINGIAVLQKNC